MEAALIAQRHLEFTVADFTVVYFTVVYFTVVYFWSFLFTSIFCQSQLGTETSANRSENEMREVGAHRVRAQPA